MNIFRREWFLYVGTAAFTGLVLFALFGVGRVPLEVPFTPDNFGDADLHAMLAKAAIQHGWVFRNPHLGAPGEMTLFAYPMWDNLHLFAIRLLGALTGKFGSALNLYYYLTYPLTALTSLFVFRHFGLGALASAAGAVLYAFLPYHAIRGENHLFLAAYWLLPLVVMVSLWLLEGRPLRRTREGATAAIVMALLGAAGGGGYYIVFAGFFVAVSGACAAVRTRGWKPVGRAAWLIALLGVSTVVNFGPNLWFTLTHPSPAALHRTSGEAELYGMKLAQLLLPVTDHRWAPLAALKHAYNEFTPALNENDTSALGLLGAFGLLNLLFWRLLGGSPRRHAPIWGYLGALTAWAVCFATVGGIGALVALAWPMVRAYNRVSIFIGFFSMFSVAILIDNWRARFTAARGPLTYAAAVLVVVTLGVLDQTPVSIRPPSAFRIKEFREWIRVTGDLEEMYPKAQVFQYPYLAFPEAGKKNAMGEYDPVRPYLHSRDAHWSYGAPVGSAADGWQRLVTALPVPKMIHELCKAGFTVLYVDRYGVGREWWKFEDQVRDLLGVPVIAGFGGRIVVFPLHDPEPYQAAEIALPQG